MEQLSVVVHFHIKYPCEEKLDTFVEVQSFHPNGFSQLLIAFNRTYFHRNQSSFLFCLNKFDIKAYLCFRSSTGVEVVVGAHNLLENGERYTIKEAIAHEDYNHLTDNSDIGLIRVNRPIKFSDKVQPIKYSNKFIDGGKHLQLTGWGQFKVTIINEYV